MITLAGHSEMGRTLAENLGNVIAVGVGSSTPGPDDRSLDFEVYRSDIRARAFDPETGITTFSATIPASVGLSISEVSILDTPASSTATNGMLAVFDPGMEEWEGGTWVAANVRVGYDGLRVSAGEAHTPTTMRVALAETRYSDSIQVAYFGEGGTATLNLVSTEEDYFSTSFPVQTGYNIFSKQISEFTVTGQPNIHSITGLSVTHAGSGGIVMDAIRVHHLPAEEVLILRQRFPTVYHKIVGTPLDIDIPVEVNA